LNANTRRPRLLLTEFELQQKVCAAVWLFFVRKVVIVSNSCVLVDSYLPTHGMKGSSRAQPIARLSCEKPKGSSVIDSILGYVDRLPTQGMKGSSRAQPMARFSFLNLDC
jgi:hypothetical protein